MRRAVGVRWMCVGALAACGASAWADARAVLWRSDDPPIGEEANPTPVMDRAAVARVLRSVDVAGKRVVVHISRPVDDAVRAELADAGVTLVSALGGDAFVARVSGDRIGRGADRGAALMASVEQITPMRRMHPALSAGDVPAYSVVATDAVVGRTIAVAVEFQADASAKEIDAAVRGAGGVETSRALGVPVVTMEVAEAALGALASSDAVAWVEPVLPGFTECNAGCRALVQADALFAAPYSLTGAGVGVMVFDAGRVLATHVDFQGRVTTHDSTAVNDHSTHVAGTIGGGGVGNSAYRGIAPGVTIRSYGFEYDGTGTFLATNPGDVESDYRSAFIGQGCVVGNASLGTNVEPNGFPCSLQGDYTTTGAVLDAMVHGSLGVPVRAIWAAGNERQGSRCDVEGFGDYYSIAPPACAKNPIVVGAVDSDTDLVSYFSSWGPTDDGRLKPDVVAPGCQASGDGGVTSTSSASTTAYTVKCGTSMATPVVTGVVPLMVQDFKARHPGMALPSNAACKSVLVQTAKDIGAPGPDYSTGYGSVRGKDAIDLMRAERWAEGYAGQGTERTYLLDVVDGSKPVRVTLAWDDAPGSPSVVNQLVNDLDLVVIDPNGVRRFPWTLNPIAPGANAVRTAEDHRNNVEQVVVDAPTPGVWAVIVRGTTVPSPGSSGQGFAIAASHDFVERAVELSWIDAPPALVEPGDPFPVRVLVEAVGQELVAGSVRVRTRIAGSGATGWDETAMTDEGDSVFGAMVQGPACDAEMEIEVAAAGAETGDAYLPDAGPMVVGAGTSATVIATTCEVDDGWTVNFGGADTASAGAWGRMDPQGTAAQPEDDSPDAGAQCWVTDGRAGATVGAYDVDGGMTSLTSPAMDLSGARSVRVTFWGWFSNTAGADPGTDVMTVRVSGNNGATWATAEVIGPKGEDADGGWFTRDIELVGLVPMGSMVRVRFEASDVGLGSVVEAAVDDLAVTAWWCDDVIVTPPSGDCPGDVNGDGVVNVADFNAMASAFGTMSGATRAMGDVTGDGRVDAMDFNVVASNFGKRCE